MQCCINLAIVETSIKLYFLVQSKKKKKMYLALHDLKYIVIVPQNVILTCIFLSFQPLRYPKAAAARMRSTSTNS